MYYSQNIHCICHEKELARAYIPFQQMGNIFPLKEGLIKGTIFPELYRPYEKGPWANKEGGATWNETDC